MFDLSVILRVHSFSAYAKILEEETFLTPLYAHTRVRIGG